MWYIAQGCIALNTSIDELVDINTAKLSARYPDGFDKDKSNNRKGVTFESDDRKNCAQ